MRILDCGLWDFPSSQVLSVLMFHVLGTGEPLLPNLETLKLFHFPLSFVPFSLSLRVTSIFISFSGIDPPKLTTASMITTLPALCPHLHTIRLIDLPRDPIITHAVSDLVLNTNQNTLRDFRVDSPLTKNACETIYKHPDLHTLYTIIDKSTVLPAVALPNLTHITIAIEYHDGLDWLQSFHGASL